MSTKVSNKVIRDMIQNGMAIDITSVKNYDDLKQITKDDGTIFETLYYSRGTYGINGIIVKGWNSGRVYGVAGRTGALFMVM